MPTPNDIRARSLLTNATETPYGICLERKEIDMSRYRDVKEVHELRKLLCVRDSRDFFSARARERIITVATALG